MPWVKGQSGNPNGGKRGPRAHKARYETMLWADLVSVWREHGSDALLHVAKADPTSFVRICVSALPKTEIEHAVNHQHQIEVVLRKPAWLLCDSDTQTDAEQAIDITPQSTDDE